MNTAAYLETALLQLESMERVANTQMMAVILKMDIADIRRSVQAALASLNGDI